MDFVYQILLLRCKCRLSPSPHRRPFNSCSCIVSLHVHDVKAQTSVECNYCMKPERSSWPTKHVRKEMSFRYMLLQYMYFFCVSIQFLQHQKISRVMIVLRFDETEDCVN